jgi:hypothetical protein
MRITTSSAKVTFVLVWAVGGLMLNVLLGALGIPVLSHNLIALAFTAGMMTVGVRTFRGAGEPVDPPRAWWRATGRPASSLGIGLLLVLVGGACLWAITTGMLSAASPFTNALVTGFYFVSAAYYFHSWWRLSHDVSMQPRR